MTFEEKSQWAYAFAALVTAAAYFTWLAIQLAEASAESIEYRGALLWTIGLSMLIHSLGTGMVRGSNPGEAGRRDDRDRDVIRRGDSLSFYIFSGLAAVPLVLGLLEVHPFWIVNSLFAAFAVTAVLGVVIKATLYRKGL